MVPLRARLHYSVGGFLCRLRGEHRLTLVEAFRLVPGRGKSSERRPLCLVCWRMPGD